MSVKIKARRLIWPAFGAAAGAALGFAFGKGDPQAPVVVAGIGTLLGLLASSVVRVSHQVLGTNVAQTHVAAMIGAPVGAVVGGVIGAFSGFGRIMIAIFNPDLMEQDFGMSFGTIGGVFLGALIGVCLAALTVRLFPSSAEESQSDILPP